jgi:phenylalanine-4-hydroxylase
MGGWIVRRHPGFAAFMRRYGAVGVALASLVRIPKTAFYVWLIVTGWA